MSTAEESPSLNSSKPINVTVLVGSDAVLPCVADGLENVRQIIWQKVDDEDILNILDENVIKHRRNYWSSIDHRSKNLTIIKVKDEDRGLYGCRISTKQGFYHLVYLEVLVPPTIIDSSPDPIVKVGSNVNLTCKASGHPHPDIMWRREDGEDFLYEGINVTFVEGAVITLSNVTRHQKGSYICIASNGIPPTISKRIRLQVEYEYKDLVVNSSHQLHSSLSQLIAFILVIMN